MATLSVLKFGTPKGAEEILATLEDLQKQQLITIQDAAVVSWEEGKKKPKTRQLYNLAGLGALSGAFWGMLFGLLFFIPLAGLAIGAGMGALTGAFSDIGIDDDFIKKTRDQITPGTSALFLMSSNETIDKVVDALKPYQFELIASNMSQEQEDKLRAMFVEGE
jgi:uncharacterized membrane protein